MKLLELQKFPIDKMVSAPRMFSIIKKPRYIFEIIITEVVEWYSFSLIVAQLSNVLKLADTCWVLVFISFLRELSYWELFGWFKNCEWIVKRSFVSICSSSLRLSTWASNQWKVASLELCEYSRGKQVIG